MHFTSSINQILLTDKIPGERKAGEENMTTVELQRNYIFDYVAVP